jgi:serine/threonine protein phosphatase 1
VLTALHRRFGERLATTASRTVPVKPVSPRIPAGFRVYAVGDIHGRDDLLQRLQQHIANDMATAPEAHRVLVYLGDYIDRGPDSYAVVEHLLGFRPERTERVFLKGNHEAALLEFLNGTLSGGGVRDWMGYGGQATLPSYGIACTAADVSDPKRLQVLRDRLLSAVPERHQRFYHALLPSFAMGDYLFVHAGVNPAVSLEAQTEEDLLWIREPFLRPQRYLGKMVVHGHTIAPTPEERPHRIGIDTGAYATGHLTALVLTEDRRSFLQT